MTVDELIGRLLEHPGDAVVCFYFYGHDGASHCAVDQVQSLSREDAAWDPWSREEPPERLVLLSI